MFLALRCLSLAKGGSMQTRWLQRGCCVLRPPENGRNGLHGTPCNLFELSDQISYQNINEAVIYPDQPHCRT
jgi:hypothetical protein